MTQPVALVVDDEPQMVSIIEFALSTQGFQCFTARNASEAWNTLQNRRIDLVILDIMLPDTSGRELCRRIRAYCDSGILMLTALGTETDRIRGLEAGADDYLTKPFSPRELALRAQALVRRLRGSDTEDTTLSLGELNVDSANGRVTVAGELVHLTDLERKLMAALARNYPEAASLRELANEVWGVSLDAPLRDTVKTTVYRLRKRLQAAGVDGDVITSQRGNGYCLDSK